MKQFFCSSSVFSYIFSAQREDTWDTDTRSESMYPVLVCTLPYGKPTDQLQRTATSTILRLCWFLDLRRPELELREEGQLVHAFLSLQPHIKLHCELRGWEWTEYSHHVSPR